MKETALIRAAHNGHLAVIKRLLAAGASIDAIDLVRTFEMIIKSTFPTTDQRGALILYSCHLMINQGDNTALHWSAMRGHVEIVRTLITAGADTELQNAQVRVCNVRAEGELDQHLIILNVIPILILVTGVYPS